VLIVVILEKALQLPLEKKKEAALQLPLRRGSASSTNTRLSVFTSQGGTFSSCLKIEMLHPRAFGVLLNLFLQRFLAHFSVLSACLWFYFGSILVRAASSYTKLPRMNSNKQDIYPPIHNPRLRTLPLMPRARAPPHPLLSVTPVPINCPQVASVRVFTSGSYLASRPGV